MLADVEEPTAPFGLVNIQGDGSAVEETRQPLDAELAQRIRRQAQRHGVSAAALFHLAWALVVGKAAGKEDVVFGTVLLGRMQGQAGAERALGLFINTLPVRVGWAGRSVEETLRQVHIHLTGLMNHEHARLSLATRCSAVPAETPLFSSLLNYRHSRQISSAERSENWQGLEVLTSVERTNYPLGMSVTDLGVGFELVAQTDKKVGPSRVCDMMQQALIQLTDALAEHSNRPACELNLLGKQENKLLTQWAAASSNYPDTHPIHGLFERQAAQHPEAIAVIFEDRQLSYRELNSRANRLAHYLIRQGVQPETRVGIAVERSIEMVVGLLAILKAGGAYVPIDPDYPADRIAHILADSGVELLLTQSHLRERLPVAEIQSLIELDVLDLQSGIDCQSAGATRWQQSRLCDLHLRFHRQAQGCAALPSQRQPFVERHRKLVPFRPQRCLDVISLLRLRFFRLGNFRCSMHRWSSGGGAFLDEPFAGGFSAIAARSTRDGSESDPFGVRPIGADEKYLCGIPGVTSGDFRWRGVGAGKIAFLDRTLGRCNNRS
ncbi:MAG: AMP-binding protein [Cellvibrionaceae bacterium]|nr:AMP-binding protein [Cellvibrionaceae bacterium]